MPIETIKRIDRTIKWWLFIFSVLTLGALVVAALQENVFAPWKIIRSRYAAILEEKATDERGRAIADQFEVRIVQNFIPKLDVVDRCMTCHPGIDDPRMTGEIQPFRAHSGDYLKNHPPEQYGCTICHRGQGRALMFEEAKAVGHHWDYPLLPIEMTQSSCGMCHSAEEVRDRGGANYALGKQLFETKGCYSCHKLHGRGGSMGPELDLEGMKIRQMLPMAQIEGTHTLPQWLIEHFRDPQKVVANSQMKPPQLDDTEITALTTYMLSLQGRDIPRSYLTSGKLMELYMQENPEPFSGQELYDRYCATCHDTGEFARYDKFYQKFFPAIRGVNYVQIASENYLRENIRLGHPGTIMPAWGGTSGGLTDDEITKVVTYLKDVEIPMQHRLEPKMIEGANDPAFKVQGDMARGAKLFEKHCTACHLTGLAPDLFNATFQNTATDGFVFTTILQGRKNTPMPKFFGPGKGGFDPNDISDLTAYILHSDETGPGSQLTLTEQSNQRG